MVQYFLFVTGKNEVPGIREIIYHHINYDYKNFVTTLWRMKISRGACSTLTAKILQMENYTVRKTWSNLHSLSSSSNHGGYSATCMPHYGLYLVMCHPFIILSSSFWPFLFYFSPFRLLFILDIFLNIVINTWQLVMISSFFIFSSFSSVFHLLSSSYISFEFSLN